MPERAVLGIDQVAAVAALDQALRERWPGVYNSSREQLVARFPKRFNRGSVLAGWLLPQTSLGGAPEGLYVLCDIAFPYSLPKIALERQPPAHTAILPHVEEDGAFCLATQDDGIEMPADIRHVVWAVEQAQEVWRDGLCGANKAQFIDEIGSYWTLHQPPGSIWTLLNLHNCSQVVHAVRTSRAWLLADDKHRLKSLPPHFGVCRRKIMKGLVVRLSTPLYPNQYPQTVGEAILLIATASKGVEKQLAKALHGGVDLPVVLSFVHEGQSIHLGLILSQRSRSQGCWRKPTGISAGYRPDHLPHAIRIQRLGASSVPVQRCGVTAIDASALLHRTTGEGSDQFRTARVGLVGCGSLGSEVAVLLAKAGIRQWVLVDEEALAWQNVGRHQLSGAAVGSNKVDALKRELLNRFPDYQIETVAEPFVKAWGQDPSKFDNLDIIVALTGDWPTNAMINHLSRGKDLLPPVVFGWVEAFALSGHCVLVHSPGGCLQCISSLQGRFKRDVGYATNSTRRLERNCGSSFQPFSAVALTPTASMIAKAVLDALLGRTECSVHRAWVGAQEEFEVAEVRIRGYWERTLTQEGYERVYRFPLRAHHLCPVCAPTTLNDPADEAPGRALPSSAEASQ